MVNKFTSDRQKHYVVKWKIKRDSGKYHSHPKSGFLMKTPGRSVT